MQFSTRFLFNLMGPFIGIAFVFGLFSYLEPKTFPTADNMILMLRSSAVLSLVAVGMTVIIISGGIDLSVGSQLALGTVITAWMLNHDYSTLTAAFVTIAAISFCGLLIGVGVSYFKLLPFIITLGAMTIIRGAALCIAPTGTINSKATDWPDYALWMTSLLDIQDSEHYFLQIPKGVWLVLLVGVIISAMLHFTRFGRHVFAIGSNEQTAILCGVKTKYAKILVYTLAGAITGLGGVLLLGYGKQGDATAAPGWELQIIAGVVIGGASLNGGRGSILGSMVGILLIMMIENGCSKRGYDSWVQLIVTGAIIIAAVALDKLRQKAA